MKRSPAQSAGGLSLISITRIAGVGSLVAAIVVATGFLFPFVVPRAVWFRTFVGIGAGTAGVLLLRYRPRWRVAHDYFGLGLLAFLAVSALSGAVGVAPTRSFFGDLERMGGVWTLLHLFLLYVLLRAFFTARDWDWLLALLSVLGGVVAVSAGAHYLGIGFASASRRPGALLGNPGYVGGLMLVVIPLAALGMVRSRGFLRPLHATTLLLAPVALLLSLTRASLLGAGVGAVLALVVWAWHHVGRRRATVGLLVAATLVPVLFLVVRATPPDTSLRRIPAIERVVGTRPGTDAPVSQRLVAWRAAATAGADHWLLGWGPENEMQAISSRIPPSYYRVVPSGERIDRSHNVLLDAWVTTGALGLLAYLLMWGGLFRTITRAWASDRRDPRASVAWAVVLGGVAGHLVHLLFWMPDLTGWIYLVCLAAMAGTVAGGGKAVEFLPREEPAGRWLAPLIALVVTALIFAQGVQPLLQARRLHEADAGAPKPGQERLVLFEEAVTAPATQKFQAILRHERFLQRSFNDPTVRTNLLAVAILFESAEIAERALRREIRRDPYNDLLYARLASLEMIAYQATGDSAALASAVESTAQARRLAPGKIRYDHLLSQVLLTAGDTAGSRQVLEGTLERYAEFGETHAMLARTALITGDVERAAASILQAAETGWSFDDPAVPLAVADALGDSDPAAAADVLEAYMASRYEGFPPGSEDFPPYRFRSRIDDFTVLNRLPALWAAAGALERARLISALLAGQLPEASEAVRVFARSLAEDVNGARSADGFVLDPARLDAILARREAARDG